MTQARCKDKRQFDNTPEVHFFGVTIQYVDKQKQFGKTNWLSEDSILHPAGNGLMIILLTTLWRHHHSNAVKAVALRYMRLFKLKSQPSLVSVGTAVFSLLFLTKMAAVNKQTMTRFSQNVRTDNQTMQVQIIHIGRDGNSKSYVTAAQPSN